MTILENLDFDTFKNRLPRLKDISLNELFNHFDFPKLTADKFKRDRPELWNSCYLPVLPGDIWLYIEQTVPQNTDRPRQAENWMNVRKVGAISILFPNSSIASNDDLLVMFYDSKKSIERPIMFNVLDYRGTFIPAFHCMPVRGLCEPNICTGECTLYRDDDVNLGGKHFYCECE